MEMSNTPKSHDTLITDSINYVELHYCDLKVHILGSDCIHIFPDRNDESWHIETDKGFLNQILTAIWLVEEVGELQETK